jgi:uncharacterized protein (UPF0371 family)
MALTEAHEVKLDFVKLVKPFHIEIYGRKT